MVDYRVNPVEIPELEGWSNFRDWKRAVSVHLRLSGNAAFISANPPTKPAGDEDSDEVIEWLARRTLAWWCIRGSIGEAIGCLEVGGWDGIKDDENQDPKALWDKVAATFGSLMRKLEELCINQGLAVAFLDARRIHTSGAILPRTQSHLLNITFTGRPLPSTALTLPELRHHPLLDSVE
ncbi:hypothetical protein GGTG_04222 [Gaeumannomyces tritici R3-111a-1]|uniref:Uncharacterized protein n=1 Tax=Gaeumannomyces tritici (strain R3-111a-1) TaxID=644352 RepID=J3NSH0_GAET3|nr:hypothetical protein GGTG_04222 [Gaeumannomyces tritici R3-111a-1]EJT79133.1 hypothetical protein GGTG_04222 [Gaeumannomyces tritici R3-111a-1]